MCIRDRVEGTRLDSLSRGFQIETPSGIQMMVSWKSAATHIPVSYTHLDVYKRQELEIALPKAIDKISVPLSLAEQQRLYQYVHCLLYTSCNFDF